MRVKLLLTICCAFVLNCGIDSSTAENKKESNKIASYFEEIPDSSLPDYLKKAKDREGLLIVFKHELTHKKNESVYMRLYNGSNYLAPKQDQGLKFGHIKTYYISAEILNNFGSFRFNFDDSSSSSIIFWHSSNQLEYLNFNDEEVSGKFFTVAITQSNIAYSCEMLTHELSDLDSQRESIIKEKYWKN